MTTLPKALADMDNAELTDLATAIDSADIVVLLVDHSEFKALDTSSLLGKSVIDTRGIFRR